MDAGSGRRRTRDGLDACETSVSKQLLNSLLLAEQVRPNLCSYVDTVVTLVSDDSAVCCCWSVSSRSQSVQMASGSLTSDLKLLLEDLHQKKTSVYRSIPYSRLASNRDAHCYRKARPHLMAFKVRKNHYYNDNNYNRLFAHCWAKIGKLLTFKKVSSAHQGCVYLFKNAVKINIL